MKTLRPCSAIYVLIILVVPFAPHVNAQTTNPRWISEMPAPERILREIKGKDAEDTIERQMGVFKHLLEIIDKMAYGLEHRFMPDKATPDEYRIKEVYGKAYADLWYKAKNRDDKYVHDWDLHFEMMDKFFSKGFHELYRKSDKNSQAFYEKHRKESAGMVFTVGPKDQPAADGASNGEDLLTRGLEILFKKKASSQSRSLPDSCCGAFIRRRSFTRISGPDATLTSAAPASIGFHRTP